MNWEEVILSITTATVTGMGGLVVWWIKQSAVSAKATDYALRLLLRSEIRKVHEKSTKEGGITYDEMEDLLDIQKAYNSLGGNGSGDRMVQEVTFLPRKPN